MIQKTNCNLCGSPALRILYRLSDFNLLKCDACGLVCREMLLEKKETVELYSETYFTKEQHDYFFDKTEEKEATCARRLEAIAQMCPHKGHLLDIGCAIGTFPRIAKSGGWEAKGVEVSVFASAYAREKYGLDVRTGELEEQTFPKESFDVVTLWDVIDHIERPQEFLSRIHTLLKPGGLLVQQTTMEDSLLYRIAHYLYVLSFGFVRFPVARCHPMHHSTFYSSKTLQKAFDKAVFKIIRKQPDDLNPELINTVPTMRMLLKIISFFASLIGRPLEYTFYAQKTG